jgi:hypothetical protein
MPRRPSPPDPFRWFDSSPEVIQLVVMLYVTTRVECVVGGRQPSHPEPDSPRVRDESDAVFEAYSAA